MKNKTCENCKEKILGIPSYFKQKLLCLPCYIKSKNTSEKKIKRLIIESQKRAEKIKKKLEKRNRLDYERKSLKKFIIKNRKPIPKRVCKNPSCPKKFRPNSVLQLFCNVSCRKDYQKNVKKEKSKNIKTPIPFLV